MASPDGTMVTMRRGLRSLRGARWKLPAVAGFLPVLATVLASYSSSWKAALKAKTLERDGVWNSLRALVAENQVFVLALLAGGGLVLAAVLALLARGEKKSVQAIRVEYQRRLLRTWIDNLHARYWGQNHKQKERYRVSVWIPNKAKSLLECFYRSDGGTTEKTWRCERDDENKPDGVVGLVYIGNVACSVDALPEDPTDEDKARYVRECYIQDLHSKGEAKFTWPGAALLGTPLQVPSSERPVAVLLVERHEFGKSVRNPYQEKDAEFTRNLVLDLRLHEGEETK